MYKAANHKKNQQSDYKLFMTQDFPLFSNLNTPAISKKSQYGETFLKHVWDVRIHSDNHVQFRSRPAKTVPSRVRLLDTGRGVLRSG
jgi:hypothetical protein